MKKIVNYLVALSTLFIWQKDGLAQQKLSSLKIYDLNPGMEIDSTVSKEGKSKMFVNFKLSDVTLADSVFFRFGTTKGGQEVLKEVGQFTKSGSVYSVKTQGPSYPVRNSEVSCRLKITKKQYKDLAYLSLVVKDKTGLFTNVLTMRIN